MFIELHAALTEQRDRLSRLLTEAGRFQKVLRRVPATEEWPMLVTQIKTSIDQIEHVLARGTSEDAHKVIEW